MPAWLVPSPPSRSPHAFTLIEMIVVLVLLAILASLTIPRMLGNDKREFQLAVDQVGDLMTMYAQRQTLSQKVVGLVHDRRENRLLLVSLDPQGDTLSAGNWIEDRYVKPVVLPSFMYESDVTISMNGDIIDTTDYPASSDSGQERPWIEITLRGVGQAATISLSPHGVAPMILAGSQSRGAYRAPYDLDNAGRSREDW